MDLATWKSELAKAGVDQRRGSLHNPWPLGMYEVSDYLQRSGWVLASGHRKPNGMPFLQTWHFGLAPIHLQIQWDGAGRIAAIRLSDETGEEGAPAVFITELDLGLSMRELEERFDQEAFEVFFRPWYGEMTGQGSRAESLV